VIAGSVCYAQEQASSPLGLERTARYDGKQLHLLVLQEGAYAASTFSRVMAPMTADTLLTLLQGVDELDAASWLRRAQAWARGRAGTGDHRSQQE
jgi:HEAT repeat protein